MSSRTPKKVDVYLPGPSPKATPASQIGSAKKPASTKKRAPHSRTGSVASLAREDTLVGEEQVSKPVSKAGSVVKPRSSIQRLDTSEDLVDEVSVSGDTRRQRKTEADRRQFLEEDPNSGEVEPHRMYCKACSKWVDLNPKLRYIMKRWVAHRKRCGKEESESSSEEDDKDENASVAPSITGTPGLNKRVMKEEDRKAIIEASPNAGEVLPNKVFCKGCSTWIKLATNTRYSLSPWRSHSSKCNGVTPSTRVATAQRKLRLVNDSQVKEFAEYSITCGHCSVVVKSESDREYDLTNWEQHKTTCDRKLPLRSPPSVASTEETVVGTEHQSTPQKSKKRSREEDTEETPDRTVRQRGESYEPTTSENPGFLSWITQPFKNFIRDFRRELSG
ncbi:uncharacterized protein BXZ73DRAFT_92876 [Epithele typhae]|uniref:uncharacterized protein n=1 Tax=Epithele typhae TaxID=378194 RepID=UPI00200809B0|nr:uncharacterized protein BXZ73DRAFT_92876 [Epithele typhae]KAH9913957.1 hypothetical protein BXZ73DRAFT_92876 [Epithele typhae]